MDTRLRGPVPRPLSSLAVLLLLGSMALPAAAQPLRFEVVTGGFAGPLGVQIDQGRPWTWVSEAGTGNDDGRITVVTPSGPFPFATGFRSIQAGDETNGLTQLRLDGTTLWVAQGLPAVGESYLYAFDTAGFTPGDPPLTPDDADLVVDVGSFVLGQGFLESNPYDMAVSDGGATVYFTDAGANAVLALDVATTTLSVVATLDDIENPSGVGPPFVNAVPTGIVERDGDLYVGTLTGFPFVTGLARIYRIRNGEVSVYRDGLTTVTDVAVDPEDGQLVALEFAEFDLGSGFLPGTARLVKLYENGARQVLADGLDLTPGLDIRGDHHAVTSLFGLLLHGTPAVDLDVTPDAPVTTPGALDVTVTLTNNTDAPQTVTARWRPLPPSGGEERRPPRAKTLTLAPGQSVSRTFTVRVPAGRSFRVLFSVEGEGGLVLDTDVLTIDVPAAPSGVAAADPDRLLDAFALDALGAPEAASAAAPAAPRLVGSAPNPFADAATLTVTLDAPAPMRLAVYDALGREVAVLVDGTLEAGTHQVRFDGAGLPSGVYVARLTTGGMAQTLRMTLLR